MWIVIKTKSGQEDKAHKNLENQEFRCFLPKILRKYFKNNQWIDRSEVMFTSYIFVKITKDYKNISKINNTYGVSKLLVDRSSGLPHVIDNSIISDIGNNLLDTNLKSGDKVIYTKGSLSVMNGIYKEPCGKNRAKLFTKILNKYREISVNNLELQKVISR